MVLKVLKHLVLGIDSVAVLVFAYLLAALLPGDGLDANVLGSVVMMVISVIVATAVSVPTEMALRNRGDSLLDGIKLW